MLFFEQIAAAKRTIKLQVFASDVDEDAVALAREGLYPDRSRRMCRRRGSPASLPRRSTAIG